MPVAADEGVRLAGEDPVSNRRVQRDGFPIKYQFPVRGTQGCYAFDRVSERRKETVVQRGAAVEHSVLDRSSVARGAFGRLRMPELSVLCRLRRKMRDVKCAGSKLRES